MSWGYPLASGIVFRLIVEGILEPKGSPWCPNEANKGSKILKKSVHEGSKMDFDEHVGQRRKRRCQIHRKTKVPGIANLAEVL